MNDLMAQNNNPGFGYVDPAAVAAAESAKARIQAAYLMALHKPRNEDQARIKILKECERPSFAEHVEFRKPINEFNKQTKTWDKKFLTGPSIRFAELALREWRNVDIETQTIYEDETVRRIKVRCLDLETNTSFGKEIQIAKTVERKNSKDREVVSERTNSDGKTVFVVKATEDELQTKTNALISKAIRNEGLRLIPGDIIDEARSVAAATQAKADKSDPQAAKKKLLDSFASLGVYPAEIEKYLGHKTDSLAPKELTELRAIYAAIRDGETTWQECVKTDMEEKTEDAKETLKAKLKAKKPEPTPEPIEEPARVKCPNSGDSIFVEFCDSDCAQRQGCPAHGE
ncbi:MAG: hypothetical protein WC455_15080 [Dehalococcoidia bacterium]|jgi:hypothetical protein